MSRFFTLGVFFLIILETYSAQFRLHKGKFICFYKKAKPDYDLEVVMAPTSSEDAEIVLEVIKLNSVFWR